MEVDAILQRVITAGRRPSSERPLASLKGEKPVAPAWYRALQIEPPEVMSVSVEGADIEVLAWGERGKPGLLLAHGNRAHARWWGPVAPLLAKQFRVVSLSYSGMGGSGWRPSYTLDLQVEELFAAAQAGGLFEAERPPVFVAHSFGSRGVAHAMAKRGRELTGVILVDSTILPSQVPPLNLSTPDPRYPTIAEALSRFNLKPPQACENLFILDDVARGSLVEGPDGWRWRFDPEYLKKTVLQDVWDGIAAPPCKLAFIYGEDSATVQGDVIETQRKQAPPCTPFIGIPNAGHHLMFDQPVAVATTLSALKQSWLQG
jgi:pimeloyl-ACP methyl ester carboxylesterase